MSFSRLHCVIGLWLMAVVPARADDLGIAEWPATGNRECVVLAALTTTDARDFHAAFSRQWCLQGWAMNSRMLLRESSPQRWITHVDILRNDELLLTVPMSPYVAQHVEQVAAAVVARIGNRLLSTDSTAAGRPAANMPGEKQPGGERK